MKLKTEIPVRTIKFHRRKVKGFRDHVTFTVIFRSPEDGWTFEESVDMRVSWPITKDKILKKIKKGGDKILRGYDFGRKGVAELMELIGDTNKVRGKIELSGTHIPPQE